MNWRTLELILRVIAVIVAGASMRLISPPVGWVHLHWFNLVLAFWALKAGENKRNAILMYLFSVSLLAFNYDWVRESVGNFSNLPMAVAWAAVFLHAFVFAIPFALLGYCVHRFRTKFGLWWVWMIPALQAAIEHVWPALFPYTHGALFYRTEIIWQWASVFGATGVTYLIFLSNAGISELIYRRRNPLQQTEKTSRHLLGIMALFGLVLGFGHWRHGSLEVELEEAPKIKVALMQQKETMRYRLQRSTWQNIEDWSESTFSIMDQNPDLVIWPEGALGGPYNPDETRNCTEYPHNPTKACWTLFALEQKLKGRKNPGKITRQKVRLLQKELKSKSIANYLKELTRKGQFELVIGGGSVEPFIGDVFKEPVGSREFTAYNSIYHFNADGEVTGRYDKMVPLPFGEYIPLSETFPIIRKWIKGPGNFKAGKKVTTFNAKAGDLDYTFTTPICYEAILPAQMHKMKEADVFVNITNDSWFGDTQATHQHGMLAAVTAMEWGRPLIRSAYTGVSFIVEPHGKIVGETGTFEETANVETVRALSVQTIYRSGGWLFPWLMTVFSIGTLIALRRGKKTDIDHPQEGEEDKESSPNNE